MKNKKEVVAVNDSQILRWISQLNGIQDLDIEVKNIKTEIKRIKKEPKSRENKDKIEKLYDKLFSLQYQKDYFCMIMNNSRDYDKASVSALNTVSPDIQKIKSKITAAGLAALIRPIGTAENTSPII